LLIRLERLEQRVALEAPPLPGSPDVPALTAGLSLGAPAPTFQLSSVDGTPQLLPPIAVQSRPTIVLFVDPDCGPCHALLPNVERWRQEYRASCAIIVISRGTAEVNRAKFQHHPHGSYLLQRDREVAAAYRVEVTPSAVLVRPDGTIGSTVHAGAEAIRRLVEHEVQEWTKPVLTL
jgi:thiol-disulfide isomerase/thioredoxin